MGKKKMSRKSNRRGSNGMSAADRLAYKGPPGIGMNIRRVPVPLPVILNNEVISKVFRFKLAAGVAEGTTYNFSAAKLCSLLVYGTATNTTATMAWRAVMIRWIELRSTVTQVSGQFGPLDVGVEFAGTGNGQQGSALKASCMSIGATEVGAFRYTPNIKQQAAQWQDGSNVTPPILFSVTAGGGSVLDIALLLSTTGDTITPSQRSIALSLVVIGQEYWLALDNNAGGNLSTSNQWTPMPNLVTTT